MNRFAGIVTLIAQFSGLGRLGWGCGE